MGIIDAIKGKADELDKTFNPMRQVADALTPTPPTEAKTPNQLQYEAKEKAMNANNPGYVPRAKGGCVKAGGAPVFKNVDNSGLKKEPC